MPKLILLTQHGSFELAIKNEDSVLDVLKRNGIPSSMVSLLLKNSEDSNYSTTSITTKFSDLQHNDEVLARVIRNIDVASFIAKLVVKKTITSPLNGSKLQKKMMVVFQIFYFNSIGSARRRLSSMPWPIFSKISLNSGGPK